MNRAYKHIQHWAAQASLVAAAFMAAASPLQAATEPAPAPSATCQKAQKDVNKDGLGTYTLSDLTAHPTLAGQTVEVSIKVKDALGQAASSEKCKIEIPHIDFRHPVAIAMVELRRTLAQDSRQAPDVATRFGKLIEEKSATVVNPETLAKLNTIQGNLATAQDVETMEIVVRDMWQVMQILEQENMSAAERRLRELEKALREALQRGANEEQIRKLTEESMEAMKEALKEQAAKASQSAEAQKKLEDLQKQIEEMQKMLEQLQNMDPKAAEKMQEMMKQMQEMMKEQQKMEQLQQQMQKQQQNGEQSPQQQQMQQQQQQMQESIEQRMQRMQRQMQQMQQQMQQQQQMQKMQQDMSKLIEDQEKLRNQTAEEREKRKEDMAKVLEQLEKYARELKDQIDAEESEAYQRQYETPAVEPASDDLSSTYHQPSQKYSFMALSAKTGESYLVAEMGFERGRGSTMVKSKEYDEIVKQIERLKELETEVETTAGDLKQKREDQIQLKESEAEAILQQFQRIQSELQKNQDKQLEDAKKNQDQRDQDYQQKQKEDRQQQQQTMQERIQQMIEQLRKKQQQQEQQEQNGQKQQNMTQQQKDLQKRLQELMEKMKQKGMDPGKLQDADKSMDDASGELQQGDPGDAVPKQDRALEELREGQEQMKKQMQQMMQKQPGQGDGPGDGEGQEATMNEPRDVLGRAAPRDAQELGPIDSESLSRQRRDEIRERLKKQDMPQTERDYLERLLKGGKGKLSAPSLP